MNYYKSWKKNFILCLILTVGVNLSHHLLATVLPLYAINHFNSNFLAGMMTSCFTISALITRFCIKKISLYISLKRLLQLSLIIAVIANFGYYISNDIVIFLIFRIIHGLSFGVGLACSVSLCNSIVPKEKLGDSVAFTASAATIASALGPSIALELIHIGDFPLLFIVTTVIAVFFYIEFLFIEIKEKKNEKKVKSGKIERHLYILLFLYFIAMLAFGSVSSFLTVYADELNLGNIGLFFTFMAVSALISRLFYQRLINRFGLNKILICMLCIGILSLMSIAFVNNRYILFLIAIPYGITTGIVSPIYNFRLLKRAQESDYLYLTSLYYCAVDAGLGLGALLWGIIANYISVNFIYVVASGILLVLIIIDSFYYRKWGL